MKRRPAAARRSLAALLVALGSAPAAAQEGSTIVAVEVRSDAPLADPQQITGLLALVPGQPFGLAAARRTLRNLHATGAASEIEIHTRPAPGGVVAIVALWSAVIVDEVRLAGEPGLRDTDLRHEILQRPAEPLQESRVLRSVYRLQDLYRAQGYLEATVRVEVTTDPARQRAVVTFHLQSGERATIAAVDFTGDRGPFTPEQLRDALQRGPGERYSAPALREDAERLQRWLFEQGHGLATVEAPRETYDRERHAVSLVYPLAVGPKIEVEVTGADLAELRRRGLLPFLGEEGYDEALVLQAADRIRRHFQERGHYKVRVEREEERRPERIRLLLAIAPGPVYTLTEARFSGNQAVDEERLGELIATAPRRLLRPGSGRLVDAVLADDLANLRSYLARQGYLQARVGPERVTESGDELALTIPIHEGPRTLVSDLEFEGVEALAVSELRDELTLRRDGPFHPLLLEESVNLVRALYEERGYARTQVEPGLEWNEEKTAVAVTLRVLEGPRTVVDRVVLRGNRRTRGEVVRRFIDLDPGEPVSARRLLDVQRSLYRLGIFSRVAVELVPTLESAAARDVVVRVEEGSNRRLTYSAGYDSDDGVLGAAGYSHGNIAGRALSLQLDLRASQKERQARALFNQPYLFRWQVPVTYAVFRAEQERESFESQRWGTQVEAFRVRGSTRVGLLYTYRIVDLELNPGFTQPSEAVARELRGIEISSLTPTLLIDRRDDPLEPTRGWSGSLQLEYAFPLLSAREQFLKGFLQGTYQRRLFGPGVVAASLRLGGIEPLADAAPADPTVPAPLPSGEVPISERFFLGGRTTHRSYERDFLGIRGATLLPAEEGGFAPVGGDGLALVNLDYRFPIAGAFGGIVFVDSGNVWADWRDVDLSGWKSGAGLGVRYVSPIGPLRLEVGWKLDREDGESPYEVFLSFGNPF